MCARISIPVSWAPKSPTAFHPQGCSVKCARIRLAREPGSAAPAASQSPHRGRPRSIFKPVLPRSPCPEAVSRLYYRIQKREGAPGGTANWDETPNMFGYSEGSAFVVADGLQNKIPK